MENQIFEIVEVQTSPDEMEDVMGCSGCHRCAANNE
jgi:hypothetical protein